MGLANGYAFQNIINNDFIVTYNFIASRWYSVMFRTGLLFSRSIEMKILLFPVAWIWPEWMNDKEWFVFIYSTKMKNKM